MSKWSLRRHVFLCVLLGAALVPAVVAAAPSPTPSPTVMRDLELAEDRRDGASGVLQRALGDADAAVRARAALAIGRLQDSSDVTVLVPLLRDRVATVRREAVFALGQIGHRSARPALESALRDGDAEVVELAVEALGKLGDPAATPRVVPFLRRGTPAQRMRAGESLWRLADTSATGALLDALRERDPAVRWRVVYALEKLPTQAARIVSAVSPLVHDPDALVRAHAARTLGRLKSPLGSDALRAALDDASPAVVVNAVRGLQLVNVGTGAPGTRIAQLLHHRDPYVRVTAASALADSFAWVGDRADSSTVIGALRHGTRDSDAATRGACGHALLVRTRLAALEVVRGMSVDTSAYVRTAIFDGLRTMQSSDLDVQPPRVANALAGAYHVDAHPLVRMTAAEVAGQLIGRTHHASLQPMLEALRQGLEDRDLLVAAACAGALADAGDSVSVARLTAAYVKRGRDADADARIAIRDALRALAGRAYADSVVAANPEPAPPATRDDAFHAPPAVTRAIVHTSEGDMEWAFFGVEAPQTVKNFALLASRGYFDGLRVHRVVPDFVIQDGDPTGTGSGGPGWTIRCEYNRLRYETGMVGMALSGKDTGGSQWFVTLSPQPHLNGRYTIFARVTRGLDVAGRITQGTRIEGVEVLP